MSRSAFISQHSAITRLNGYLLDSKVNAADSSARLVVGTMHTPPFAIHSDEGHWSGVSVELFEQIAGTLGVEVEWREYDYDLQGLLFSGEQQHLDAAIAALPMKATYEETVDFSYAYFLVEDYGIVLPTSRELRERINRALLQAIHSPAWKAAIQRYVTTAE